MKRNPTWYLVRTTKGWLQHFHVYGGLNKSLCRLAIVEWKETNAPRAIDRCRNCTRMVRAVTG